MIDEPLALNVITENVLVTGTYAGAGFARTNTNQLICYSDSEIYFLILGDFGSKNRSKMRVPRDIFSTTLLICEKCDFERQYIKKALFPNFEGWDFRL